MSNSEQKLKVALIHDYLTEYGGAEKVLEAFIETWPQADVFTTDFWPEKFPEYYSEYNISTSFLSKLPFHRELFNQYKLFHTFFFESIDLSKYDLVISNSSSFSKGVLTPPSVPHISYILTPPRFLWGRETSRHDKLSPITKTVLLPVEHYWRLWDYNAAQRADIIITISNYINSLTYKAYKRKSQVIYPPVNVEEIIADSIISARPVHEKYFFTISRLEKYKRIDLLISAFKKLPYQLYIAGAGEDEKRLKDMAAESSNIKFLGRISEKEKIAYMTHAEAFLFPGEEDFGIVMVESLASGTPVITYKKGGALDIVTENESGLFFEKQHFQNIIKKVEIYKKADFDKKLLLERAHKFSKKMFKEKISHLANKLIEKKANDFPKYIPRSKDVF